MKIKRNKKSYRWFLCGLILVVVLTISYRVSKANYRISNSIELTTGKVISSPYDFNIVSMYIDGVEQDKDIIIPDNGYTIDEEKSYCYKDSKSNKDNTAKLYSDNLGNYVFSGISKGSKCILYLKSAIPNSGSTMEELLKSYYVNKKVRLSLNKDFNIPFNSVTKNTVYMADDADGTSYYFAGNPLDNWVEFGGYYWRIIRINGDGSVRLIYQGRTKDENGQKLEPQATGKETQIEESFFNEKNEDNAYVGFMYGTPNSSTYELTHENKNDSTIKQALDNWFNKSNIRQGTENFNKIDLNAGFCGDRTPYTNANGNNFGSGIGTDSTYYGIATRLGKEYGGQVTVSTPVVMPTFNCTNNGDLYTSKSSIKGNKALTNPVGLITADEVSYAGIIFSWLTTDIIQDNYLTTGNLYWTMSPYCYPNVSLLFVHNSGYIINSYQGNILLGIRPVINLRSDVEFTGNGTQSNPYKVVI